MLSFDEFGLVTGCYHGIIEKEPKVDPNAFRWDKNERNISGGSCVIMKRWCLSQVDQKL